MATNSPAPYNTPMYQNGSMTPAWLAWFNAINEGAAGGSIDAAQVISILAQNLPNGALDFSVPPILTNFAVTDGFNSVFLAWDQPNYPSFDHVEVYRSVSEIFTFAIMAGTTLSSVYTDTPPDSTAEQTFYYWVRAVNRSGVKGPFNAVLGTIGKTSVDPEYLLNKFSDALDGVTPAMSGTELVFSAQTFGIKSIDEQGVDKFPFIVDSIEGVVIDTAVIKDASIADAKIGSLKADKIQAGTISASVEMTAATLTGSIIRTTPTVGMAGNGGIKLQGKTLYVYDDNGVVRVKLGLLS